MAQDLFDSLESVDQDLFDSLEDVSARPAAQDIDTSDIPQSGPPGGGANASTQTILGSDDFPDAPAEPARQVAQQAPRARISAVDESLALDNPYTPASAEDVLRTGARAITAPSRYGAKAGRAMGEEFTRDTVGKFGMEASPEAVKQGGEVGSFAGHLLGKGLEFAGLAELMPVATAGRGLATLGEQAIGRMGRSAAVMGADEAIQAVADDKDAGQVAKAGAQGAALGGAFGLAGAIPGATEFYLNPKFQEGIMKAVMPRLLSTSVQAGIGAADARLRGGDKIDQLKSGAIAALFGFITDENYSARDRRAALNSAIKPTVDAMGGTPEAAAHVRGAVEQALAAEGRALRDIQSHPNFPIFLEELAARAQKERPGMSNEHALDTAKAEAAKLFIKGEISLEELAKIDPIKIMADRAKAAERQAQIPVDVPEPVPLKTAPISDEEAWANAMVPEVQAAQGRAGGDMEAISRALEMPPSQEAPAAAEGPLAVIPETKPIYEMSKSELDAKHDEVVNDDRSTDERILGAEGAKEWNSLHKRLNSQDRERSDAAAARIGEIEASLSEADVNALYGIGGKGVDEQFTADNLKAFSESIGGLDDSSPEALGRSLAVAITDVGNETDPSKMTPKEQRAYARIREGYRIAKEKGWDTKAVSGAAITESASRFPDKNDAAFMLERFVKAAPALDADGDIAFYSPADQAEEILRAPATHEELALGKRDAEAPVHELAPQDLAQRFPDASPEVQERLLRRVAQAGYPISPEAAKTFPALQADIEEGARAAALKAAQGEGESNRPGHDLLKRLGGVDRAILKKNGEFSETKDIKGGVIKNGGAIRGWDHAAEILHQHGLIRERDAEMAKEFIIDESKKPLERGMGPGASSAKALKVKPRPLDMLPEEVIATAKSAGIKVGAKVPLIRGVNDPVFGKIAKGSEVTILALDIEGANAIVEYKDSGALLQATDIAVVPITAMAKPVMNSPREVPGPAAVKSQVLEATGVRKDAPKTITEAEALVANMKAQERAAKTADVAAWKAARVEMRAQGAGHRAELAAAKKAIAHEIEQAFIQKKWEQATRNSVVKFIKDYVPAHARGDFVQRAVNADSPGKAAKVFRDAYEKAQGIQNREMMGTIRKLVDGILSDPRISPTVKAMVRERISGTRLENWTQKTIEKVMADQAIVDKLREEGKEWEIPQFILDKTAKLGLRPLDQLGFEEMLDLTIALRELDAAGKDIKKAISIMNAVDREETLEAVIQGATNITSKESAPDPLGSWAATISEKTNLLYNAYQEFGMFRAIPRFIVREFGGAEEVKLLNPIHDARIMISGELNALESAMAPVVKKHGPLTSDEERRLTAYSLAKQKDVRPHLLATGFTNEEVKKIVKTITPKEKAYYDAAMAFKTRPGHTAALARVAHYFGIEFKELENHFWIKVLHEVHLNESSAEQIVKAEFEMRRENVDKGHLIERKVGAAKKIRTDWMGVLFDGVRGDANLKHMAIPLSKVSRITSDPRYALAKGKIPVMFWKNYIDTLARDGRFARGDMERLGIKLINNTGAALLSFQPQVGLLQLSSYGPATARFGLQNMLDAQNAGSQWDGFVTANMPIISHGQGGDYAVSEALMNGGVMGKAKELGFSYIVAMDQYVRNRAALAAYFQYCRIHNIELDPTKPVQEGLLYAQREIPTVMASRELADLPLMLSRAGFWTKLFTQFSHESWVKLGILESRVIKGGSAKDRATEFAGLAASTAYTAGVRWGYPIIAMSLLLAAGVVTKDQYDDFMKDKMNYQKQLLVTALQEVPPIGAVAGAIMYDSSGAPSLETFYDVFINAGKIAKGLYDHKEMKSKRALVQTIGSIAALAGAPGAGLGMWIGRQHYRGLKDARERGRPERKGRPKRPSR